MMAWFGTCAGITGGVEQRRVRLSSPSLYPIIIKDKKQNKMKNNGRYNRNRINNL